MKNSKSIKFIAIAFAFIGLGSCKVADLPIRSVNKTLPANYTEAKDTVNTADLSWRNYFTDSNLNELIDTALKNNQELNMVLREIEISRNEIMARQGEYQPFGFLGGGLGYDRSGHYTWNGVSEEDWKTRTEKGPRYIGEQSALASFSWEIDIWNKLHNAKDASVKRYMASIEGRNFLITNLVFDII